MLTCRNLWAIGVSAVCAVMIYLFFIFYFFKIKGIQISLFVLESIKMAPLTPSTLCLFGWIVLCNILLAFKGLL